MILVGVSSVFVPFEKISEGDWKKRDDLPRFLTSREAMQYLYENNQRISWKRFEGTERFVQLEWREHSEPDLIKEYAEGVGTPKFNRRRHRR